MPITAHIAARLHGSVTMPAMGGHRVPSRRTAVCASCRTRVIRTHAVLEIVQRLRAAAADRTHQFWPDSQSLLDERLIDATRAHGPRQLTDVYLLSLAVNNGGRLVSFEASIAVGAVKGAQAQHLPQL